MYPRQRGLTLIELVVTIAVLAILVGIAVPSFYSQIQNNRSAALGEEFVSALNFARIEAVKRGRAISLCASEDGEECSGTWDKGWIAVLDGSGDKLQGWGAPPATTSATVTQGSSKPGSIRFGRLGTLANPAAGNVTINLSHRGCTGTSARTITVSATGLLSISHTACPQGDAK